MNFNPQRQEADIYALKQQVADLQTETISLQNKIQNIQNTTPTATGNSPQVENFIRNGDASHSWYTWEATSVPGDQEFECWQVYSNTAPISGQNLKEDSVFSGSVVASSLALADPGRSDTPIVDPNWNQTDGYIRLGSTNSVDFPLPSNVAFPGRLLYVSFICARASANVAFAGSIATGIWDNTAGQRDFLSAAAFTVDAATVGIPVATTSRDYFLIGILDSGRTLASNVKTLTTAPSDTSFVSGSVYSLISWTPFPGLSSVDIYRKTGATYVKLKRIPGGTGEYFDDGSVSQEVGAFPEATGTVQQAYAKTRAGALSNLPIDGAGDWLVIDLVIAVPATYNQGNTTDKQWLRIFLTEAPTGTDATRGIFLDLISMSYNPGIFAHHPDDLKGARLPISAPNGSSQGGTGSGGSFVPPDPGDGGPRCIWEDCEVLGVDNRLRVVTLTAKSVRKGSLLISPENDRFFAEQVQSVKTSWADSTLTITTELGHIRCSPTEPFKSVDRDILARDLKPGDQILQYDEVRDLFVFMFVKNICISPGAKVVMITMSGRRKYFLARNPGSVGWFELHNLKPEDSGGPF